VGVTGGPTTVSIEGVLGHVMRNLCFCIRWDMQITLCIPVHLGCETLTNYLSCSGGRIVVSIKSALEHIMPNLCFCLCWDMWVTWSFSVRSGHETLTHYFSCSGGGGGRASVLSIKRAPRHICSRFVCSSASAHNCQGSTSPGVFSSYCIYIFPREEGFLSCLRLTQGVTPMSTTRLYKGYVNWG
jgi:hypothetical protein